MGEGQPEIDACLPVPQSSLSCVLRIAELLSMIFLLCIPEDGKELDHPDDWSLSTGHERHFPGPSGMKAPLLLAHVCQHWRIVALSTPRLWARIHLMFTENDSVNHHLSKRRLDALLFWLNHSCSVPISVFLTCANPHVNFGVIGFRPIPAPANVVLDILDTLFQHQHRWEHIRIEMAPFAIKPFYDRLDLDYPHLRSFELIPSRRNTALAPFRAIHIRSAPNLEELALPGVCERDLVVIPSGLPSSLRTLELKYLTVRITPRVGGTQIKELVLNKVHISDVDFRRFPTAFPALDNLTISLIVVTTPRGGEEVSGAGPTLCVFDRLTRFKLRSRGLCSLLKLIVAPALRELSVIDEGTHSLRTTSDEFSSEVYWLIRRSNAPVERFRYSSGPRMASGATIDMLSVLPELRELVIRDSEMSASTVRYLENAYTCPRLTFIYSAGNIVCTRMNTRDRRTAMQGELHVRHIVNFVAARCCKLDGRGFGGPTYSAEDRVWVKKLAFPMHRKDEEILRADELFKEADVQFTNTHVCDCDGDSER